MFFPSAVVFVLSPITSGAAAEMLIFVCRRSGNIGAGSRPRPQLSVELFDFRITNSFGDYGRRRLATTIATVGNGFVMVIEHFQRSSGFNCVQRKAVRQRQRCVCDSPRGFMSHRVRDRVLVTVISRTNLNLDKKSLFLFATGSQ